jgi:hypothetical protein
MITEKYFKAELLRKLNNISQKWCDGDLEKLKHQRADIINRNLKIVIEIKDDVLYTSPRPPLSGTPLTRDFSLKQKNRQFRHDLKLSNKKFKNYPSYKTMVILRTDLVDTYGGDIEDLINGPFVYIKNKKTGSLEYCGQPSALSDSHDNSTSELGSIVFLGSNKYLYKQNDNPNVKQERILDDSNKNIILECLI